MYGTCAKYSNPVLLGVTDITRGSFKLQHCELMTTPISTTHCEQGPGSEVNNLPPDILSTCLVAWNHVIMCGNL